MEFPRNSQAGIKNHWRILFLIALISGCATPSILVTQEQNLGDDYFNRHNYSEAVGHYNSMLAASQKLGIYRNVSMESSVHRKIANCYEMMGNYDEALLQVAQSMSLDSAAADLTGRIQDYREQGKIQVYSGRYKDGIASLEKALKLSDGMEQSLKNTNRLTIADTYIALGQLYSVMGKPEISLDYISRALALFKEANEKKGEMESYLAMGSVYADLGDITSARNLTGQSLRMATDLDMGTTRHYQLLASVSRSTGEYEDALRNQEKALDDAVKYKIAGQIIWSTIGMGDIYQDLGDFQKAARYYRKAREARDTVAMKSKSIQASLDMRLGDVIDANQYYKSQGSLSGSAVSYMRLAEIFIGEGKADSAFIMADQAGKSFRAGRNTQGLANTRMLKGRLLVDKGDYASATPLLDSASKSTEFPESQWQAFFHEGRMYEAMGNDEKAIGAYRSSIGVIEKIRGNLTIDEFKSRYFDTKRDVYDRLINLLIKTNKLVDAFLLSEQARARAFYDILSNRKIDFRGAPSGDLVIKEQEKRIEVQKLYKLLQKGTSDSQNPDNVRSSELRQVRSALTDVQAEYEDILQKLKLNNPAYAEIIAARPATLTDIQSRLDNRTAVLEYWVSDDHLLVWLIKHDGIICRSDKMGAEGLASMVADARKAIESNSSKEYSVLLKALYSHLVSPVESGFAGITDLVIIPNQSLHFLPFQALADSKGTYLIQKMNLEYSPSASVFVLCSDKIVRTGKKFLGMALSDVSVGNNPGLPGTADELKKILPMFPENIAAFGNQCSEEFVRKNAVNSNYLHFATHGTYNFRQPLYSSLFFPPSDNDDGRLNVFEVFEMNLNARLVTLSACETGLGDLTRGDELTGLSRAFLYAGSASVVVSLWSVSDYPTALLMADFYKYMGNHSIREALSLAQRDVMKQFPEPSLWSPFILVGNGNLTAN